MIENPWDDRLIHQLLSEVPKPISAYSNTFEWEPNLPVLKPKGQLRLGKTRAHTHSACLVCFCQLVLVGDANGENSENDLFGFTGCGPGAKWGGGEAAEAQH